MDNLPFLILSLLAVIGAIGVISLRSPVNAVLCLLLTMVSLAGHYAMLNAPFMAAVQVIVYAGAIIILFLFVVVLLNLREDVLKKRTFKPSRMWYALPGLGVLLVLTGLFRAGTGWISGGPAEPGTIEALGHSLFTRWLYPFELTGVLLLAAMVGAVAMTRRNDSGE
ncbi:MAG: NADH-quinone oxidoreductase subunit J [Candidatus Delongbacteria bacterium]|nr:NADH-quinone oxidoreductase subunit J [Candidatus Cloacimonadota bacterium]MCB9474095.1 NADH-quinone oxidoreductase subunit J [Candidatus Delongbacteria bacterium]